VVGAGAAGLVAARRLSEAGLHPTVLERGHAVGGLWALGEARADGAVYPGLVTNLPKELMAFHDFPFDCSLPSFVRARDVARYLQAYALKHSLEKFIQFGKTVTCIEPICLAPKSPDPSIERLLNSKETEPKKNAPPFNPVFRLGVDRWRVSWQDEWSGATECADFDAVVCASGHYEQAVVPEISGLQEYLRAGGSSAHSQAYKTAAPFAGKRVVVVGARASGTDIAREILNVAAAVTVADPSCTALERVDTGAADTGADTGADTRAAGTANTASSGELWRAPALVRLEAGRAVFCPRKIRRSGAAPATEGVAGCSEESVACDALVLCTGYAYSFPFLRAETFSNIGGLVAARGKVSPLHLHLFHAGAPGLSFVGLPHSVVPFPLMDAQATLVARVLADDARAATALPPREERLRLAAELDALTDPLHLGNAQWGYVRELARLGGFSDAWLELRLKLAQTLYNDVSAHRPNKPGSPDAYRRAQYELYITDVPPAQALLAAGEHSSETDVRLGTDALGACDAPERARVRRADGSEEELP